MKKPFENLTLESFDGPIVLTGRIIGGFRHGFNSSTGSWCLSDLGGGKDGYTYTPAYFILFVQKWKRKPMIVNDKHVISCKPQAAKVNKSKFFEEVEQWK